jgi:hypothetical protein
LARFEPRSIDYDPTYNIRASLPVKRVAGLSLEEQSNAEIVTGDGSRENGDCSKSVSCPLFDLAICETLHFSMSLIGTSRPSPHRGVMSESGL